MFDISYDYHDIKKYQTLKNELVKVINKYIGFDRPFLVSSATMGLLIILRSLVEKSNMKVIIPKYTHPAIVNCCLFLNIPYVFVDVKEYTGTIKYKDLHYCISNIEDDYVPVVYWNHFNGYIDNDFFLTLDLCKKYGYILIEDTCHSYGIKYKGKYIGTFGDFSVISFSANKIICTYKGGIIQCNNINYYDIVKKICTQGTWYFDKHEKDFPGINSSISLPLISVLLKLIPNIQNFIDKRKQVYYNYKKYMPFLEWNVFQNFSPYCFVKFPDFDICNFFRVKFLEHSIETKLWNEIQKDYGSSFNNVLFFPIIHDERQFDIISEVFKNIIRTK